MSFVQLPDGIPNFRQAVISLWFRVPKTTIDAARAGYDSSAYPPVPFAGIVPLLTFGKRAKHRMTTARDIRYGTYNHRVQNWMPGSPASVCGWQDNEPGYPRTVNIDGFESLFSGREFDIETSYIGVDCRTARNLLAVNILMDDYATMQASPQLISSSAPEKIDWNQPLQWDVCGNNGDLSLDANGYVLPERTWGFAKIYDMGAAAAFLYNTEPERFATVADTNIGAPAEVMAQEHNQDVAADHWHHLLLSFDLTFSCDTTGHLVPGYVTGSLGPGTTSSACRMWISFDDVNLTERKMSIYWPQGLEPNAILTPNAMFALYNVIGMYNYAAPPFTGRYGNIEQDTAAGITAPSCAYTPGPVPAERAHLGLPAAAEWISAIRPAELAELQFFTGVTLNTGDTPNRRAFVDDEGKPVPPAQAEAKLGKKPDLLLHGSGNWIKGLNTGLPATALKPTGLIIGYTPDPSLRGPQEPASPPLSA